MTAINEKTGEVTLDGGDAVSVVFRLGGSADAMIRRLLATLLSFVLRGNRAVGLRWAIRRRSRGSR